MKQLAERDQLHAAMDVRGCFLSLSFCIHVFPPSVCRLLMPRPTGMLKSPINGGK